VNKLTKAEVVESLYNPPAPAGAVRVRGPSSPPHPADGLCADVNIGGGAIMTIVNPASFRDGDIGWRMNYGGAAEQLKHTAISLIASYDYLLSNEITGGEAISRLRLLRAARAALKEPTNG